MKKILIFGSAVADIALRVDHLPTLEDDINPESQTISLGGCACNVSSMLSLFHVPFTLAVPTGKGIYGDFVRKELSKRNIPVWKESDEVNGSCTCLITDDGNRTFLSMHGAEYHYRKEWLDTLNPEDYSMVYICGIDMEEEVNICVLEWLQKANIPVCFACGPRITHLPKERIDMILDMNPILHLNSHEAEQLLNILGKPHKDALTDSRTLSEVADNLVIITKGAEGCVACNDGEIFEVPSFPVKQIDGTGAGDSHIGTILACLFLGRDLKTTLETASVVSSEVVQIMGPVLSEERFEKIRHSFPEV